MSETQAPPVGWADRIVGSGSMPPEEFLAHPQNYRIHSHAQEQALAEVLDRVGYVRRVLVNRRTGHVLDGHLRVSLAISRNEPLVPYDEVDLDEVDERLVLAALDPIAAMAGTDHAKLAELMQDFHVEAEGAFKGMLDALVEMSTPQHAKRAGQTDPDAVPDERPTNIVRGDMFQLGDHRLLCGDSTSAADVARLMDGDTTSLCFTSPPYNLSANARLRGSRNATARAGTAYRHGADDSDPNQWADMMRRFTSNALSHSRVVAVNVQMLAGNKRELVAWLHEYAPRLVDVLIWVKTAVQPAMAEAVVNSAFEFVVLLSPDDDPRRTIETASFARGTMSNVYVGGHAKNEYASEHGAAFSVEFATHYIENLSPPGAVLFEPFSGTGTVIIAAESIGRSVRAIELVPVYAQIAIDRWEAFTGQRAVKIGDANGSIEPAAAE